MESRIKDFVTVDLNYLGFYRQKPKISLKI